MLKASLEHMRTILCLGAHADDIEIGCGGTLLKLLGEHKDVDVHWVVLAATGRRADEAVRSAKLFLQDAGRKRIVVKGFRDTFFPYQGEPIKHCFQELQREISPDVVFTHRREDLHQDHRLVSELTWCSFRDHLILEYEIPKYEGDLGNPNVYVPLSRAVCQKKVESIVHTFETQQDKRWFTEDTFWSLLRIRGVESNSPTRFSEALHCRKMII